MYKDYILWHPVAFSQLAHYQLQCWIASLNHPLQLSWLGGVSACAILAPMETRLISSLNVHVIRKQEADGSVMSALFECSCQQRACISSSPCTDRAHWGGGDHALSLRSSAAAAFSHSGTSNAQHAASWCALVCTLWGYLDLHVFLVYRFYMTVRLKQKRIVDASQCLIRGREARPKCQIRYNLSCGCAVTVLPPVPQVYEIHDSSLCFHGLSLERISSPSSKWKDCSLPCANGCTACRKTLGKNPSWLTKETTTTRTLRGKVFG